MTTISEQPVWHAGELAIHKLLSAPNSAFEKPGSKGLPAPYAYRISASPLVAFGTLDDEGRPWTTIFGGERGFARTVAANSLGVTTLADRRHDPVIQALLGSAGDGKVVRTEGGKALSALSVDLETRDRVKIAGRMMVGVVAGKGGEGQSKVGELQLLVKVEETLGNCPKYMNKKRIRAHLPEPKLVTNSLPLPKEALELIEKADMFFLTSANGEAMDTNHRGGPPGFVRVVKNENEEVVIVYPEYSGNRLYETLGNLYLNPKIGITIPDFETSDVLHLTGTVEILIGQDAAALLPHTKLAIKIIVTAARFIKDSLPFRGTPGQASPYNPPVRRLATELSHTTIPKSEARITATLTDRIHITPTVNRYTFTLSSPQKWHPGQYITLDFAPELDMGWSHMADNDPQSLNDDFVRTFTISNVPGDGTVVEITARTIGPVTRFLSKQNVRAGLEIPVLGFGGEDSVRIDTAGDKEAVFVAAGVGITPLMAQAPSWLESDAHGDLQVIWSLRAVDLGLAVDVLKKIENLAAKLELFVTGKVGDEESQAIDDIKKMGSRVVVGRLSEDVVVQSKLERGGRKYYICVSPAVQKVLMGWLEGQEVIAESFNY